MNVENKTTPTPEATNSRGKTGWVYALNKESLQGELAKFGLTTEGTVEELRRRMVGVVHLVNREGVNPEIDEANDFADPIHTDDGPPYVAAARAPVHLCEVVRKWNVSFDGKTDPVAFLERVEELRLSYDITGNRLLQTVPELLKGAALLWHRNNRDAWAEWNDFVQDFRAFYLPPNYALRLEEDISRRRQRAGEKGRDYVTELQTLIRRHGSMSTARALYRLYTNLLPEYRQYIKWRDIHSIADLVREIEEYEQLQADLRSTRNSRPPPSTPTVEVAAARTDVPPKKNPTYNRSAVCWRCGKEGHFRQHCHEPSRLFCSRCGKEGTLSRECTCPRGPGNDDGADR